MVHFQELMYLKNTLIIKRTIDESIKKVERSIQEYLTTFRE